MAGRGLIAALTLLLSGLGVAGAQGPRRDIGRNIPLPPEQPSPTSATDDQLSGITTIDVVVTTADGRPLSGLTRSQFKLRVDGKEQTFESFEEVDGPVTVALLLEFGALLNRAVFDQSIIAEDRVLVPAEGVLRSLESEDWAAIVGYDGRPWTDVDFTQNKVLLVDRIREWRLSSADALRSAFYDAVYVTLDRMESMRGTKAIVLFSSGWDRGSSNNFEELLAVANASGTTIYAVGMSEELLLFLEANRVQQEATMKRGPLDEVFFPDPVGSLPSRTESLQARNALRSLASATGGTSFFPVTENQYAEMLDTINVHLRSRYRLGIVLKELRQTGQLREISVELAPGPTVPDPESVTLHHRKGLYF